MDPRPRFLDQFRDDPVLLLGPVLALAPAGLLAWLASFLGG